MKISKVLEGWSFEKIMLRTKCENQMYNDDDDDDDISLVLSNELSVSNPHGSKRYILSSHFTDEKN